MMKMVLFCLMILAWPQWVHADWVSLWFSPDQQAQRLFDQGDYAAAAKLFTTPDRIGAALYKAGEFAQAAAVFGRSSRPEDRFNRGNSLVLLGQYDEAIMAYQQALETRPDWPEAEQNLAIAELRRDRLAPPDDDAGGTGGQLGADEIVFDTTGRVNKSGSEQTMEEGGESLSEEAMRAMWLRRVETRPADFLANRFAYQLAKQQNEAGND